MNQSFFDSKFLLKASSLKIDSLLDIIDQWVTGKYASIILAKQFKYSLNLFKKLSNCFVKNWVAYCFLSKFSNIIDSSTEEILIATIKALKIEFQRIIIHHQYKDNFSFHFLAVFLVVNAAHFLQFKFQGIEIDYAIKSELCIMFFHCFSGLKVANQTYKCLEEKYIKKKIARKQKHQMTIAQNIAERAELKHIKADKKNPTFKHIPSNDKITKQHVKLKKDYKASFRLETKTEMDQFSLDLKANLEVNLPKIQFKRMKSQEYDNHEHIFDSLFKEKKQNQRKNNQSHQFYSNQLSSALKFNHQENTFNFQKCEENVKLHRSEQSQHFAQKTYKLLPGNQQNNKNNFNKMERQQRTSGNIHKFSKQKLNCNDWMELVGKMKKSIYQYRVKTENIPSNSSATSTNSQVNIRETYQLKEIFQNHPSKEGILNENLMEVTMKQPKIVQKEFFLKNNENANFLKISEPDLSSENNFEKDFIKKFGPNNCKRIVSNSIRIEQQRFSTSCKFRGSLLYDLERL